MKKRVLALALAAMLALTVLASCSQTSTPGAVEDSSTSGTDSSGSKSATTAEAETTRPDTFDFDGEFYNIELYTSVPGTSTYVLGVALADMINKYSGWLRMTALESPGPNEFASMLIADENMRTKALGNLIVDDAKLGLPPFEGPYDDFCVAASYLLVSNVFITTNPEIRTTADLDGKRIALGTKPNMPRVGIPEKYFELAGIKPEVSYLSFQDGVNALMDGKVDVIITGGSSLSGDWENSKWAPNPALAELMARQDLTYISWDADLLKQAKKELGHDLMPGPITVGPGLYDPAFDEPVTVMGDFLIWGGHKDMPPEVITEVLTIMSNHSSEFVDYIPNGSYCTPETMAWVDTPEYLYDASVEFFEANDIEIRPRQ